MDNNQNQQPNGYGMPQPNMQAGMPGQTPQPGYGMPGQGMQAGYGTPDQTPQQGYGTPGQGMPGQTPQPGYGMPGQNMQPGYGMPQQPAGGNQPPKKKKTGLIVGLIILAVVLIGGSIFAFMKLGKKDGSKGSSKDAEAAKQTVVDFCEGMKNRDMDAIVDAYHPDLQSSVENNFYTSNGVSSEDEFWDHYDTVFGGYSFAYTASDATEVSDSKRESTLDIINAAYSLSLEADTMYEVDTEETYSGSNGKMVLAEQIYLIEDDGKWYVIYAESTQKENTLVAAAPEDTEEDTEETTEAEEETTEATTESAASTTPVNADGFDWENMQFTMLGKPYNLATLTYDDILAMGYSIDDDYLEEELEDNQYSMSARAEAADESDMYIRFKNFTGGGTKKVPECEILGIELSRDDFDNKYDAALGNGITFGMTPDEVKAVMGEPTDSYTSDTSDYMTLTYEENDEAYASSVEFTFQDGVLTKFDMENYN